MFRLMWRLSTGVRNYFQVHMPSNIVLSRMRAWEKLGLAPIAAGTVALAFLLAAYLATAALAAGGPQWLNVMVMVWAWNALKFAWFGCLSAGRMGAGVLG